MASGTVTIINDHAITEGGGQLSNATCNGQLAGGAPTTALFTNNASATTSGYTSGSTFAYQPTSSTCKGNPGPTTCTIGNGTNEQSICTTLSSSTDPLISAAGTACKSDTAYGIVYNSTNHTVTWPNRTSVLRPTSGAFDMGAYQFSSAVGVPGISFSPTPLPLPPAVVGTGGSGAPLTLTNTGTATTVVTAIAIGGANPSLFSFNVNGGIPCGPLPITILQGQNCSIIVNFNPIVSGAFTATIGFTDNVTGSPQSVNISATGTSPNVPSPVGVFGAANLAGCTICTGTYRCLCVTRDGNLYVSKGHSQPYVVIP